MSDEAFRKYLLDITSDTGTIFDEGLPPDWNPLDPPDNSMKEDGWEGIDEWLWSLARGEE